ncbi:MAG: lamin tail domain-containing protein [bacterium]
MTPTSRGALAILAALVASLAAGTASARVVINEILYHPSNDAVVGAEDAENLEFIELVNDGPGEVDLSGATFSAGITFTFPANTRLAAGAYLVVAKDPAFLRLRGPAIPPGVAVFPYVAGVLANSGERVRLESAAGVVLDEVEYDDSGLWPPTADGRGPSLELTSPANDNSRPLAWRASAGVSGTPGAPNSRATQAPIIIGEAPDRGTIVADLQEVAITFSTPVQGVVAADLTVAGAPAGAVACPTCVAGSGAGPWIFTGFPVPRENPAPVALRAGAIRDAQARAFAGDAWIYPLAVPRVVINEVHYNPASATDDEEFIELYNAEPVPVDVSGWHVAEFSSPGCALGPGTIMPPGGYLVCARDRAALRAATGVQTPFEWGLGDRISNGGEPIALLDANGTVVDRIEFDDAAPWPAGPQGPDGNGPSMELINPAMDNALGRAWQASRGVNGTPGAQNSTFEGAPAVAHEAPARGAVVDDLFEIEVTFTEPVVGVVADSLTVGEPGGLALPAVAVRGEGAGPYTFTVEAPAAGVVEVILEGAGIETPAGTPFPGDTWIYFAGLPRVVINEIHYHPAGVQAVEAGLQFIELYNADPDPVDLSGYSMTEGVDFIFPDGTVLAADGYLVLAAEPAALRGAIAIPPTAQVLAWTAGDLANGGEKIELSDAFGHVIDVVRYEDAGEWTDEPDGRGPTLELLNPALPNNNGGAWQASVGPNGTPGARNSVHVLDPPPIIFGARHDPPLPRANEAVTISVDVIDEGLAPPQVTLHFRPDQNPPVAYAAMPMFDDGQHGDGAAGDGRFGAVVPGLANEAQLDFYVEATAGAGTSIAPPGHSTPDEYGNPSQTYLCKFTNEVLPNDGQPVYHLLVTLHNKSRQEALVGYPTRKHPYDATFIDGVGNIWYNVVERSRGQSSLSQFPSSYRVDFPRNRKLRISLGFSVESLQLNAMRPAAQWLTFDLFNRAGLPAPRAGWAHLRYPGINYDTCCRGQNGYWGLHVVVERLDNEFLDSQGGAVPLRPTSPDGNLYRGRNDGDFRWEGPNPATYGVNANGQQGYEKYNNEAEDAWDDLVSLCDALSNTPDDRYVEHLRAHVDEDSWATYFALHMLLGNREGGLYRDTGDDYFVYFPPVDDPQNPVHPDYSTAQYPGNRTASRSKLITWDGDSVMLGANETIWRTQVAAARRFLRHNAYAPIFVKAIEDYAAGVYSIQTMSDVIDSMPDAAFSPGGAGNNDNPATKAQFKAWHANRLAFVLNETRDALTLEGAVNRVNNGPAATEHLQGQIQQAGTHAVTVNGLPATFSVFEGTWSHDLALQPGLNPAVIEAWDRDGAVKQRIQASVFFNPVGAPGELHIDVRAPRRMLNDKTLTVDAAITDPIGRVHYRAWDDVGTLSVVRLPQRTPVAITPTVFDPHAPLPAGGFRFLNGWGNLSFTLNEGAAFAPGDIEITVGWRGLTATRTVTVERAPVFRDMAGALVGANLVWGPDQNIRVTGGITVPAGSTLTIHPGTLVQVNTTGALSNGTLFTVQGAIQALGTHDRPIFFFSERGPLAMALTQQGSASNADAWRGFQFRGAGSSTFRQVFLTGAGNGTVVSHPRPPIMGLFDTHSLTVDRSVFADNNGMVFSGQGTGTYIIRKSHITRAGIGGEYFGNGHTLRVTDSWFTAVGFAPEANNLDGDLLHIDGNRSNQLIRSSIIQDGGDDGIDHNGSNFRLEHSILWRIRDKAISMTGGHADVHNTLIFRAATGIRGLAAADHVTIASGNPITIVESVAASIIWPRSLPTCVGQVSHTYVGSPDDLGCGVGNASIDPQFASVAGNDYNPLPGSPALTAGPANDRIGWLGFPVGAVCARDADCDDQNACTRDTCGGRLCVFTAILGCNPCDIDQDCDDGNPCTADVCAPDGSCGHPPMPNGTACSDDQACTSPDVCQAGACRGPVNCPGGMGCDPDGACIPPPVGCRVNADCDDGLFCNGAETCDVASGDCRPGGAPACDDGVDCTADRCDEGQNRCVHDAQDVVCDDGNLCTDDRCDLRLGCQQVNNAAPCDDGEICTEGDRCRDGACAGGPPPSCDDGRACTADRCVIGQGCVSDDVCPGDDVCGPAGDCLPPPDEVVFQDGLRGYAGTTDTYVHAGRPGQSFGLSETLIVDGDTPPEEERQILLQFTDLIGWEPGRIPPSARIESATLTLFITDRSDDGAELHRLLVPWNDGFTWDDFGDGVDVDDQEALAAVDGRGFSNQIDVPVTFDVTASVNAWLAGAENLGWLLEMAAGGTDAWHFAASEARDQGRRPMLTVAYRACARGFVGDGITCEDIDECAEHPCDPFAVCTNEPGGFTCECQHGFAGDGFACQDIDECAANACGANATCTNRPGAFDCTCDPGFVGDGFVCVDVDECEADPCDPHATCRNEPGSFACTCRPGWVGDGLTCRDDDECLRGLCDANATCFNVPGSFACECNAGFFGNGRLCRDIDECQNDPCGVTAVCRNLPGSFECSCPAGFLGDGVVCGECPGGAANPCSGVGVCGGDPASPTCACPPNIVGDACEACAPGFGGYPNCMPCPNCDDGNPCTTDSCGPNGRCLFIPNADPCDDGDACTLDDRCGGGACGGTPMACDDGNACTTDRCVAGACQSRDIVGACDDGNACTAGDTCVDRVCVGQEVDCEDGDACTVGVCDPASGCDQVRVPGCCHVDGDCGPGEGCIDDVCRITVCARCERDADCGADANRCVEFPSGNHCVVACAGELCGNGTICEESADGEALCMPEPGDCECIPAARTGCHQGDVWGLSSCYEPEELQADCAGRGCVDGACCAEGSHVVGDACVLDGDPGTPDAGVEPDAGRVEEDAGVPDQGPADATPDALTPRDATAAVDGTIAGDSTAPRADRGADASPDGTTGGVAPQESGDCTCDVGDDQAPPAVLLLAALVALRRRRRS